MAGNSSNGARFSPLVVVQARDRKLFSELGVMRLADREQAKTAAGFTSTTRANARLLALTRAGYLERTFIGSIAHGRKAVYRLSPEGAAQAAADVGEAVPRRIGTGPSQLFAEHQLLVNEVYLTVRHRPIPRAGVALVRWVSFREPLSRAVPLVPDGYFELAAAEMVRAAFVEVDLGTESLAVWKRKTRLYLNFAISGEFAQTFGQAQFRVLVVASSERRAEAIRAVVRQTTDKVFWFSSFDVINRDGFWSPVWLRPRLDQRQSLV